MAMGDSDSDNNNSEESVLNLDQGAAVEVFWDGDNE
jgi:hypothetical protein